MGIFFTRIKHHVVGNHVKRIHVKRGTAVCLIFLRIGIIRPQISQDILLNVFVLLGGVYTF